MSKSEILPLLASILGEHFIGWNKVVELNPCNLGSVPRNEITLEMCRQAYATDPSVEKYIPNEFKARCFADDIEIYMKMCFPDEKMYVYMCNELEKYIRERY